MIIWLLRFLRGYVLVKFDGVYSEQILSRFVAENLNIWQLRYKSGVIYGKILAKDFARLRGIRKGTGIKIKIIEKHGFPFIIKRFKKRSGLLVGALVFLIILEFLSCFVWVINVDGNKTVKKQSIIDTLGEIGITEGMRKTDISSKNMAQLLLLNRDDLSWASLNIEGCVLNVNVSEIKKKSKNKPEYPTNLIADKDGIIRRIDAVAGDVCVKVGDSVHKGDVLVSGIVENPESTVLVCSDAEVIAQVENTYTLSTDYLQEKTFLTGKIKKRSVIEILGVRIPLFLAEKQYPAYKKAGMLTAAVLNNQVPLKLYTETLKYYKTSEIRLNDEEVKSLLSKKLKGHLEKAEIEGYIPVSTDYTQYDGGITVKHRYLSDENIVKESRILITQ